MKWNSRIRCALVCLFFTALFSLFSFRLVYLQMIKHDEYAGLAAEKHVYKQPIFAERGPMLDANNGVLAHNTPVETVIAVVPGEHVLGEDFQLRHRVRRGDDVAPAAHQPVTALVGP